MDNGLIAYRMDKVFRNSKMEIDILEHSRMDSNMEQTHFSYGKIIKNSYNTKEGSKMGTSMAKVY